MRFALALPLLLLTACGNAVDPVAAKIEIEALVKKYHDAFDKADITTVTDMLDPDVSVSLPPTGFIEGKEKVAAALTQGMNRIKDQGMIGKRNTFLGTVSVTVDGTMAVATYVASIKEVKQGQAIFTRVFRFRPADKKWLILREHYSFE